MTRMAIQVQLTLVLVAFVARASAAEPDERYPWFDRGCHVHTMAWSQAQKNLYRTADPELLSIHRVANPDDDPVVAENDYFRNALTVQVGDTLVASHFALRYHYDWDPKTRTGLKRYNEGHSPAYVKRSTDHGRTWGAGVRLEDTVGQDEDINAFYMAAVGTSGEAIYIVSRIDGDGGIYRSDDAGVSWRLIPSNLTKGAPGIEPLGGIGPVLIDHPRAGLMIFGMKKVFTAGEKKPSFDSVLRVANSTDGGATWRVVSLDLADPAVQPVEPTALLLPDGQVFIFCRNGANRSDHRPGQILLDVRGPGDYEVVYATRANQLATQNPDTHGIIYNPRTERIEALLSNRGGSKPFVDDDGISVSLWSLPLADALAGSVAWRYHGLLNTMRGNYLDGHPDRERDWRQFQDGSHPGLGVVDTKRGRHLAFMHMGASAASFAGTYLVERSLDTDAVGAWLIEHAAVAFGIRAGTHPAATMIRESAPRLDRPQRQRDLPVRLSGEGDDRSLYHFFVGPDDRYDLAVEAAGAAELVLTVGGRRVATWTPGADGTVHRVSDVELRRGEELRIALAAAAPARIASLRIARPEP